MENIHLWHSERMMSFVSFEEYCA